jgi:hypothetical protein
MKPLLALVVTAGALLAGPARAQVPRDYVYDREFAAIARESLWQSASEAGATLADVRRVGVRCYRDRATFEDSFERRSGTSAKRVVAYYAGGRDIHLRNGTCANVRLFFLGRHTVLSAGAYAIMLHEALHRQGIASERFTTCFANESVRWGALWYGFSDAEALRARNLAFTYTKLYAPPAYRMSKPNCLAMTRTTEWIELR